jgi:hypothetical protein
MKTARISIVVMAAALAVSVTPAQAAFPGTNGRIVFSDKRLPDPNSPSIFSIRPDGSGLFPLRADPNSSDVGPGWSADGSKIVYFNGSTRSINSDGSNDHVIPNGLYTGYNNPTWSPDGTQIARDGINVVNADGTGSHFVTSGVQPSWSPDGTRIAYSYTSGGRTDVYTIHPDGTVITNLTSDVASGSNSPDWSPDNSKIVYAQGGAIWTMNSDGTGKTTINPSGANPVWSPDGTRIAYTASGAIHTMDTDGSNDALVAGATPPGASGLDWQACSGTCPPEPAFAYDVPGAAQTAYIKFVPTYRQTISNTQCAARGGAQSTHGPPLSVASCSPPAYLPGTMAHQGPYGESGVTYKRGDGYSFSGDLNIIGGGTDIRNAADGPYNPSPGPDVTLFAMARITDSYNGPGLNVPATVQDTELGLRIDCVPDRELPIGSICAGSTSFQALVPSGRNTVVEMFELQMKDLGADGVIGNADDRSFVFQGVYIP